MFKKFIVPVAAAAVLVMTSCSGKLGALTADNFTVDPNPMEAVAGNVPVTISGQFPEKYMKKKAVVTVTPVLLAANGAVLRGAPATFQGEKVMGNNQTISYLLGGRYTMKAEFPYSADFHKSDLYLSFNAAIGKKAVNVPDVKVAEGIIATSELYRQAISQKGGCIAPDTFQRVRQQRQEANVKFLINQAQLRKSELKNNSVTSFLEMLKKINNEKEAYNMSNIEVRAYASPDGGEAFNDKLASKRQTISEEYINKQLQAIKANADVTGQYTAQDWEGFQQLVAASNIQDKDVILRVLSMYKDPQEREEQIKNMSAGFRELADGILPELRRSRIIMNYETVGRSDEQIMQQYEQNASQLSIDELLYAAVLDGVNDKKAEEIYKAAIAAYPSDYRAYNNIASLALKQNNDSKAMEFIQKALAVAPNAAEPQANNALLALKEGDLKAAEQYLAKATGANEYNYAMGILNIAKGNYAAAAENLSGQANNAAALAQVLCNDFSTARLTFKQIGNNGDAATDYIHSIMCARQGNGYAAATYLKDAVSKDSSWSKYADEDLEYKKVATVE